ncbi:MAG: diguanylate cyclase [Gammaproteobacteria bacterium]|nr:diguanylate cyclase [Gammaproteobacteria bacterium]
MTQAAAPYSDSPAASVLSSERKRVLVVDDQVTNIQLLNHILQPMVDVSMARDGLQAIALCAQVRPDLVLLDIIMPGIDGIEVCRRLKADPATRDIPVIFVTGRDTGEDEAEGLDAGAVDFITKPFRAPAVLARVRNHLLLKSQADLLRQMVFIDGLTGVFNRRRFDEALDVEWRRARRSGEPLALVMIDVDHFKLYNDAYGHQAGDDCLRQIAVAMRKCLRRPGDLLARYGGEEFVCLLPTTEIEGARKVADALGDAVEALALKAATAASHLRVTISRGIAATIVSDNDGCTALQQAADTALYQAKHSGRNCTAASDD